MTGLLGALVFLTRVPVRTRRNLDTARSVPWFPVVGAFVGLVVGAVAAVLQPWASPALAGGTAVVVGLLVTGCFHEDGLADVADAFVGGWDREGRLRILKDPRHGTYGVAALGSSIVLRVLALGVLVSAGWRVALAAAVASHALARSAAVATMIMGTPATGEGLGSDYVASLRRGRAAAGIVAGVALAASATGWWSAVATGTATVGTIATAAWARRRIGGFTGDVLGAVEQVSEILALATFAVLADHHTLWW